MTTGASAATQVKQGAACSTKGQKVYSTGTTFQCSIVNGKLKWKRISTDPFAFLDKIPQENPTIESSIDSGVLYVKLTIPSASYLKVSYIDGVVVKVKAKIAESYFDISTSTVDFTLNQPIDYPYVNFKFDLKGGYVGSQLQIQSYFTNKNGKGGISQSFVEVPALAPTKTPSPTPSPSPTPVAAPVFSEITQREWQLILKDVEGNKNRYVVVYGKITQFDSGTGLGSFRADVAGTKEELNKPFFLGDNTFLSGDVDMLKNFVSKDKFKANVQVIGVYTYTSVSNIQISVPMLKVLNIELLPN
jgi:hypothetical protein